MTASVNYYPDRLFEFGDCSAVKDEHASTSIAVLLVALAASEIVILALCKAMAWYADLIFYSQEWPTSEVASKPQDRSPETIASSLNTCRYERRSDISEEESMCPICLVEFGTRVCLVVI